ncbi:VanZ family protein [Paenibacillus sp. PsM32]|uniref:VanZ family protein n=1 Tax=Paenibacillus sp. PsM32 TaxID=3030536 RepID=UPI00263A9C03|nr:VanZ family protein [Paenibacillus sp. PsM32]MDN4618950.1 VanZ family protein [Paenibacillus sp. PsM32]
MLTRRKLILTTTLLYTLFILYFMFFAFGRGDSEVDSYTFIFVPDNFFKLPNPLEFLHPTIMDIVSLGNTAAFIPFGILIPLLYPMKFIRFIILFMLSILVLETIQALTLRGSFDIGDVLKNSSGAVIGFVAYSVGIRMKGTWRRVVTMGICIILLLFVSWGIGAGIDKAVAKNPGSFVALNEWENSSGVISKKTALLPFKIEGQKITPQFNVYDANNKKSETYTYKFGGKDFYFYLNYGIPDPKDLKGSVSVSVDGRQIFLSNFEKDDPLRTPQVFDWYFEQANEITITIEGNEKAWDVGYREMKHFWE